MKRLKEGVWAVSALAAGIAMAATVTVNPSAGTVTNVLAFVSGDDSLAVNTGGMLVGEGVLSVDGDLTLGNDLTVDFAGRPDLNLWAGEPVAFVSGTATLSGPVRTVNAGDVKAVTFARDGNMVYAIAASGGTVLLFK